MAGKWDEAVLRAVDELWRENYYPPTLKQIMAATGVSSTSVARDVLRRLAEQERLVLKDSRPIALWVVEVFDGLQEV